MSGRERALVFGEVAEAYERSRPTYPPQLISDLVDLVPPDPAILEIGAGTGKATRLMAPYAASIIAVEPSAEMAMVARRVCREWPHVRVEESRFEACSVDDGSVDLVMAAQSWHWIDHRVAVPKVHAMLRPRAKVALFWNRPVPESNPIREAARRAYERYAPEHVASTLVLNGSSDGLTDDIAALERDGYFGELEPRWYPWSRSYDADEYVNELSTHSDVVLLEPEGRAALLGEIRAAVVEQGTITIAHTTELVLATRGDSVEG
jgi:SAM-dependent methyltransferase